MRLERLDQNKIKIFLTHDDLFDRGLTKEDLWDNSVKVRDLFRDMMDEATDQLGFEASGSIAVEVFSLRAQGMVVIVTKATEDQEDDDELLDDYLEMQVTLDESEDILFVFNSFEDVIQLSQKLSLLNPPSGSLYSFENKFYLLFEEIKGIDIELFIAILAEYGSPSTITKYRIAEYGKELIHENVVDNIQLYFNSK